MKAFIDTNILLDLLMGSRKNHLNSAIILSVAEKGNIQAFLSSQSIIDAAYVFSQKEKTSLELFKKSIRTILGIVNVISITENNIKSAIRSTFDGFEDAAQLDCVREAGCDVIISSDKKLKSYSEVPVYSPEEFCSILFDNN